MTVHRKTFCLTNVPSKQKSRKQQTKFKHWKQTFFLYNILICEIKECSLSSLFCILIYNDGQTKKNPPKI